MVFDWVLLDSGGNVIRMGQVHIDISPMKQTEALRLALEKIGAYLEKYQETVHPSSLEITIARI